MASPEREDDAQELLGEIQQAHMASPEREDSARNLLGGIHQVLAPTARGSNVNMPRLKYPLRYTLVASLTSLMLGLEMGALSETITTIKRDQEPTDKHVDQVTVILHLVALIGSVIAGRTADRIGRRLTIVLVGFVFFLAPFFMGIASYFFVLLGRIIAHIGVGYTLAIAPVYIAEISPPTHRGLFTSFPELFINVGIVLGYVCNYFFSKIKFHGWGLMLFEGSISLVLLAITILAMPESPQWLVMRGRLIDARHILTRILVSQEEATLQFDNIKAAVGIPPERTDDIIVQNIGKGVWRDLLQHPSPSVCHALICAVMIQLFQKASGIDTILLHIARVFEKAGLTSSDEKLLWTIVVEVLKVLCILLATLLLDKVGRRQLLLSSIGGMIVALVSLGICLVKIDQIDTMHYDSNDKKQMWVAKFCMSSLLLYVISFYAGMGPVTSVFNSEVFPLRLRAQGCTIAFAANQGASALISSIFLGLDKPIPLSGAAFSFAVVAIIAWVFFYVAMPETKGLTLEEMGKLFGKWIQRRSPAGEIEMQGTTGARDGGNRN